MRRVSDLTKYHADEIRFDINMIDQVNACTGFNEIHISQIHAGSIARIIHLHSLIAVIHLFQDHIAGIGRINYFSRRILNGGFSIGKASRIGTACRQKPAVRKTILPLHLKILAFYRADRRKLYTQNRRC